MTWCWYVAKPDELLLDVEDRQGNGGAVLKWTRAALQAAIESERLNVRELYLYRSSRERHYHIVVRLADTMPELERLAWELALRSDASRGRSNIMRSIKGIGAPDLLISPKTWPGFYREPDAVCNCEGKHSGPGGHETMARCAVGKKLRGEHADVAYFGSLADLRGKNVPALHVNEGRIDLQNFVNIE